MHPPLDARVEVASHNESVVVLIMPGFNKISQSTGKFGKGLSLLVIARSPCDEAIQAVSAEAVWIASLRSQ